MSQIKDPRQLKIELIKLEEEMLKRTCRKQLVAFMRWAWKILEPANAYVHGWHIDAIADHLHAVSNFEIENLIINVPPRHTKSLEVSVCWPTWVWLNNPARRFIFASYVQSLSDRDALKMRTLIESPEFQAFFKPDWKMTDDQNQKRRFNNTKTGYRFSTSVGGSLTGEGGDFLVCDDPQNVIDIPSMPYREETNYWWTEAMSTRANNPNKVGRVIIMQRLHDEDLCGKIFKAAEKGGLKYETLILPAEYEANRKIISYTKLGFKDPRTKDGELLWPQRFTQKAIDDLKVSIGESSHAQLQQDPKAASGGLFKREWWKRYDTSPSDILEIVQFWDTAQKPGLTNDFSVCATWARTQKSYVLLDIFREKMDAPTLEAMVVAQYNLWHPTAIVIEDKSSGSSVIQYLVRNTTLPVLPFNPGQSDKEVRATAATPTVQAGKCLLPNTKILAQDGKTDNVEAFINEHERFPKAGNDDTVDTTSMAMEYFGRQNVHGPRVR